MQKSTVDASPARVEERRNRAKAREAILLVVAVMMKSLKNLEDEFHKSNAEPRPVIGYDAEFRTYNPNPRPVIGFNEFVFKEFVHNQPFTYKWIEENLLTKGPYAYPARVFPGAALIVQATLKQLYGLDCRIDTFSTASVLGFVLDWQPEDGNWHWRIEPPRPTRPTRSWLWRLFHRNAH